MHCNRLFSLESPAHGDWRKKLAKKTPGNGKDMRTAIRPHVFALVDSLFVAKMPVFAVAVHAEGTAGVAVRAPASRQKTAS